MKIKIKVLKLCLLAVSFLVIGCDGSSDKDSGPGGIIDEPCDIELTLNSNPWAPLAGVAAFSTQELVKIKIKVLAMRENGQEIEKQFNNFRRTHNIPVLGLYADTDNRVEITKTNRQGDASRQTCRLQTRPIAAEANIPAITVVTNNIATDENRLYFVGGNGGDFIFDKTGAVRWYLGHSVSAEDPVARAALIYNQLRDGKLAVGIERHASIPYWFKKVVEMDFLGNITKTYELADYMHHSVEEFPGGRLLIAGSKAGTTGEDVVFKFDRDSGAEVDTFDFNIHLDRGEMGIPTDRLAIAAGRADDWAHINAIAYDSSDNTIVFSLRQQSALVKVAVDEYMMTKDVIWILAYPETWGNLNTELLLSGAVSAETDWPDWPYGQHSVQVLSNGNLLVFSNSTNRGNLPSPVTLMPGQMPPPPIGNTLNTNRAIEYEITQVSPTGRRGVSKVWEFQAPDEDYKSPILGSVREIENGNRLLLFPRPSAGSTLPATVMEVGSDGEVVFRADFPTSYNNTFTFHARIFSLY